MSKEIVEQIQEQFDVLPHKICLYIMNHFPDQHKYIMNNVFKVLGKFSIGTQERWIKAEKKHKATSLYELPNDIFLKIQKENEEDFINTWNQGLEFIWNENPHTSPQNNYYYNHLYLLVITHLIDDYGYFNIVDSNRLFRANNDATKNK